MKNEDFLVEYKKKMKRENEEKMGNEGFWELGRKK